MCGIAGSVVLEPGGRLVEERLRQACDLMAHRGPDGDGFWVQPNGLAAFVHRRLSVIDPKLGQQPLVWPDGRHAIVFNGEIYNYRELREELIALGVSFRTQSDTEVLLAAYRHFGPRCVDKLNGMFAFAIWDEAHQSVFLARDRIGKKPLFYAVENGRLHFASTIEALRRLSGVGHVIDVEAIDQFLSLGYVPAPRTAWQGISKLPAATMMMVEHRKPEMEKFWCAARPVEPYSGTFEQAVDELDQLIGDAVRIRLRSDVPLGVLLSGGIDSSLVTAVAARHFGPGLKTFSIGFAERDFDESGYAAEIARHLGTEHETFRGSTSMLALLPDVVRSFGEPFGDSSAINVWQLAEGARRKVTVALGGDGGDEAFCGYNWYRTAMRIQDLRARIPAGLAGMAASALAATGLRNSQISRVKRGFNMISQSDAVQFARQRTFMGADEAGELYRGQLAEAFRADLDTAEKRLAGIFEATTGSTLKRMRAVDIETYLADCLMPKVDVATMAHGLEARAPLLDFRILDFASRLPDDWLSSRASGKVILKAVLERYVPRHLFDRPKMGFTMPLRDWFATSERGRLEALASSSPLMDTEWFDAKCLRRLIAEHAAGARQHEDRFFNLLVLNEWLAEGAGRSS